MSDRYEVELERDDVLLRLDVWANVSPGFKGSYYNPPEAPEVDIYRAVVIEALDNNGGVLPSPKRGDPFDLKSLTDKEFVRLGETVFHDFCGCMEDAREQAEESHGDF